MNCTLSMSLFLRLRESKRERVRRSVWLVLSRQPIGAPNALSCRFRSTWSKLVLRVLKLKAIRFNFAFGFIMSQIKRVLM